MVKATTAEGLDWLQRLQAAWAATPEGVKTTIWLFVGGNSGKAAAELRRLDSLQTYFAAAGAIAIVLIVRALIRSLQPERPVSLWRAMDTPSCRLLASAYMWILELKKETTNDNATKEELLKIEHRLDDTRGALMNSLSTVTAITFQKPSDVPYHMAGDIDQTSLINADQMRQRVIFQIDHLLPLLHRKWAAYVRGDVAKQSTGHIEAASQ